MCVGYVWGVLVMGGVCVKRREGMRRKRMEGCGGERGPTSYTPVLLRFVAVCLSVSVSVHAHDNPKDRYINNGSFLFIIFPL